MKNTQKKYSTALIASAMFLVLTVPVDAPALIQADYKYNFSNFNGPLRTLWGNLYVDRKWSEIYVVDPLDRDIKIYNEYGMEVFVFNDAWSLGIVYDLTVDANGDIIVIATKGGTRDIVRCNYRGEPKGTIRLKDLPIEFDGFVPGRIVYREGALYVADPAGLRVVVSDMNGVFETGYDIAQLLEIADDKRSDNEMTGFSVDAEGNMLFTISVLFQAFRLSPDNRVESFGFSGSGPGAFAVVAGITSDDRGYIYVADKLKSAVLIFNKNFVFQTEFGYRGTQPHNLIIPNDIGIDGKGNLFVSQGAGRGISVFKVRYE